MEMPDQGQIISSPQEDICAERTVGGRDIFISNRFPIPLLHVRHQNTFVGQPVRPPLPLQYTTPMEWVMY